METIKAWALIRFNKILENNDDPKFMCVFRTRTMAYWEKKAGEKIVKIEIKIIAD
jgi:hypothetical protein